MDVPLDEVVHCDFITYTIATLAAVDADSTPTVAVYEEATDTGLGVGGNATKRTSLTGNYRFSFTCSAANGFELGKWYSVIASAAVAASVRKIVLMQFRIIAAEVVAGYPPVDVLKIGGTTQNAGNLTAANIMLEGTTTAGTTMTITLTGGSATNEIYLGNRISITGGTGVGQTRFIVAYDGTTKIASVGSVWTITPDATSVFVVLTTKESGFMAMGNAQAGAASSITLSASASPVNDRYNGLAIRLLSGTARVQSRMIVDYDGTTKIATIDKPWGTNPDSTTVYGLLSSSPSHSALDGGAYNVGGGSVVAASVTGAVGSVTAGVTLAAAAVQAIWDALTSALTTAGSIGKLLVDNINATISSRLAAASYTAPLDAAGTRAAVGLASANLDTQISSRASAADLATLTAYVDTEVAAILAAVDTEVAAIKAKTDNLAFTVSGQVDANIQSVNDVTVAGTGAAGDTWRPA